MSLIPPPLGGNRVIVSMSRIMHPRTKNSDRLFGRPRFMHLARNRGGVILFTDAEIMSPTCCTKPRRLHFTIKSAWLKKKTPNQGPLVGPLKIFWRKCFMQPTVFTADTGAPLIHTGAKLPPCTSGFRARFSHFIRVVDQGARVGHLLPRHQKIRHVGEVRHQQFLRGQIHPFARIQCRLHVLRCRQARMGEI